MALEKCEWCKRFFRADELTHSDHQGGKVCSSCLADQGPNHSEQTLGMVARIEEVEP